MKSKRIIYYDILNIFACICVVAMHCNGIVHEYSNSIEWKQALVVETVAYWAVPIFFMLSGAKLLTYREKYDTFTFLKKRLEHVLIPWIAWCIIWMLYKVLILKSIHIISLKSFIVSMYNGIFNNEFQTVYWFFIPMIMSYLCMPVISSFISNRSLLWYIVIVTFITYSFLPEICAIIGISYNGSLGFPMGGGYILYIILGYLLSTIQEAKFVRCIIYCLGLGSALLRYIGTYVLSIRSNNLDKTYWGYMYFTCVFLSVAVFLFFKNIKYNKIIKIKGE